VRATAGTPHKSLFLRVTKARSAKVKLDRKVLRTKVRSFKVKVEPGAIKVCVPRTAGRIV
jgi:hypothetical protein